jgi:hypothetical protein
MILELYRNKCQISPELLEDRWRVTYFDILNALCVVKFVESSKNDFHFQNVNNQLSEHMFSKSGKVTNVSMLVLIAGRGESPMPPFQAEHIKSMDQLSKYLVQLEKKLAYR